MPELLMERPKMSLQMHETLKKYILRERRKKKEEDEISEQKIREEMKKVEMNTQSLEQNKTTLKQLELKLDDLQLKRRELFNQLKKVLNEETTLKKNNRPPITLTPQAGSMPFICGPNQFSYQQLITNQLQNEQQGLAFPPQPGHPPQLINQPTGGMPIPASKTPPSSSNILTPGGISSPSNGIHTPVHLNNPKPQSPFHTPQLLHHLVQGFPLIPPGSLKFGIPTSMSPQILTAHQHASPSSSPRHHQMPANSINTPNSKRPRSPSPQTSSASPHNSNISPFVFNQNQQTPSRSPATNPTNNNVAQSPPPNLREQMFSNSPSANKKTRTNMMVSSSSSPSLNSTHTERQHQQNRQNSAQAPNNFIPTGGLTPQQQSAFSAYHHSLITGRPGPLNPSFQPTQPQQQQQQQQHNKLNKSPNLQPFQPQSNPQGYLQRGPGNLQPPSLPPPSHSPLNFSSMTSHYLNQLAKEATNKIFQQQAQQHHQQQNLQQHLLHQQQIQMLSAAAAAAAAAATHHQSQNDSGRMSNAAAAPSTGSGGGSILTGYSRSSSNPSQQRPPSNY